MKRTWLVVMMMCVMGWTGIAQAAWTLIDNFSGNLSGWTVEVDPYGYGTINIVTDAGPAGIGNSAVKINMPANPYKYARMTLNGTPQLGENQFLEVSWDQGYNRIDWNGYDQGIGILDGSGDVVFQAGHMGGADNFQFFLGDQQSVGYPDAYQAGGWFHYNLKMTASQSTLTVYNWISGAPIDYASVTPYWTATIDTGIPAVGCQIRFANLTMANGQMDYGASSRDEMYVDNLYYQVPEPATLTLLCFGLMRLLSRSTKKK